jgi:purine nucleoside permease
MKGDEISAMNWWVGDRMAKTAEDWMAYWTGGKGVMVTTAMEDCGVIHALQMLSPSGRVDVGRVMVLRTAANFAAPAKGQTPAQLLASENSGDSASHLSAFMPALEADYRVGSRVVDALSSHWDLYRDHSPGTAP